MITSIGRALPAHEDVQSLTKVLSSHPPNCKLCDPRTHEPEDKAPTHLEAGVVGVWCFG